MSTLFVFLWFASLCMLVYGLIKPSALNGIFKGSATRGKVFLLFGGLSFMFFVLIGLTAPPIEPEAPEVMIIKNEVTPEVEVISEPTTALMVEPTVEPTTEPTSKPEAEPTVMPTVKIDPTPTTAPVTNWVTLGQQNALAKAIQYLNYTAFSYRSLVEQLEYEGFTNAEAVYGADNCGANWNEQAVIKARQYIDYTAFSLVELIEQLEYEGFTHEQAVYGANNV